MNSRAVISQKRGGRKRKRDKQIQSLTLHILFGRVLRTKRGTGEREREKRNEKEEKREIQKWKK